MSHGRNHIQEKGQNNPTTRQGGGTAASISEGTAEWEGCQKGYLERGWSEGLLCRQGVWFGGGLAVRKRDASWPKAVLRV